MKSTSGQFRFCSLRVHLAYLETQAVETGIDAHCIEHMLVYLFGGVCMVTAAAVNGFISPSVMGKLSVAPMLNQASANVCKLLLTEINRVAALAGVVGMSLGVMFWSVGMLRQENPWRLSGGIGLCVGGIGVAGLLTGYLNATVPGMIAIVVMQCVWNVAVGKKLLSTARMRNELPVASRA